MLDNDNPNCSILFDSGWERMVLQILFLGPSNLLEPNASFSQMSQKLIVSPIVKTLVFSKVPEKASWMKLYTIYKSSYSLMLAFSVVNSYYRNFKKLLLTIFISIKNDQIEFRCYHLIDKT